MSSRPPTRVPTLTEVVKLPDSGIPVPLTPSADQPAPPALQDPFVPERAVGPVPVPVSPAPVPAPVPVPLSAAVPSAPPAPTHAAEAAQPDEVVERVLADLQRQIDLMLEVKLRELLLPVLTRASDAIVRDARAELASTLRDLVTRAVAQELHRHRDS